MNYTLRRATLQDGATLAHFNREMARESEGKTLDPETVRAGVEALVEHPARGFYLVAEIENEIAGALMITTEWSDWRCGFFWWVQSVYVRPEHRRQGVFSALYRHVETLAQEEANVCGLRLYVDRENEAAHRTYEVLGMAETAYRMYEMEFANSEPPIE